MKTVAEPINEAVAVVPIVSEIGHNAGSPQGSLTAEAGIIGLLLADKRSPQTRRA